MGRILKSGCLLALLFALSLNIGLAASPEKSKERCERIVSLTPAISALLVDIGLGENVVGATPYCRLPGQVVEQYQSQDGKREEEGNPPLREILNVGGYFNLNLERVIALKPDLVLMQGQENHALIAQLARFGITAKAFSLDHLERMEEAERAIKSHCFAGREEVSQSEPFLFAQKERNGLPPKVLLLYHYDFNEKESLTFPLMSAGRSYHSEILTAIGAENSYLGPLNAPELSAEAIYRLNPDWIIFLNGADARFQGEEVDNAMFLKTAAQKSQQAFEQREAIRVRALSAESFDWGILGQLAAVKEGRVYEIRGYPTQIPTKKFSEIVAKALSEILYQ